MQNIKYIFSDFDGTISKYDVIHRFIANFSVGDWTITERQWAKGEITSEECLNSQIAMVKELKRKTFEDFIHSVEIDESFLEFYEISKSKNKEIIVLSDGFDYFIKTILENNGINNIKIFSNHLESFEKDGVMAFNISFPNFLKSCKIGAGTCKCKMAQSFSNDYIYIGDGLSDRCIAKTAKLLFAKKDLEKFCKNENIKYIPYQTFDDIKKAIYKESLFA